MSNGPVEFLPHAAYPGQGLSHHVLPDIAHREPLGSGVVTRLLGQGGMANVYEIWVPQLEVSRAVKIIKPESTKDTRERFQTEIRILAKLTHPNIIDIHNVGEWKGMPYIEMEKIDGVPLNELLHHRGALPVTVCTAISICVCRALAFVHAHNYVIYGKTYEGIMHRDLKPGNIMICQNGILKLMDFGIARPVDVSFHTIDGDIVGTIQYMSPELLKGEKIDKRADIYALGATLYEIITGVNCFPETNFSKLVTMKQKNQFRPLNEFKVAIPAAFRKLVHKCMQEDPRKRYANADVLLHALEKIHHQISNEMPEVILKKFLAQKTYEHNKVCVGRMVPWKTMLILPLMTVVAAASVYWGGRYILHQARKYQEILRREPVEKVVYVERPVAAVKAEREPAGLKPAITPTARKRSAPIASPRVPPVPGSAAADTKPAVEPAPPVPRRLVDKMAQEYGTADHLAIIEEACRTGKYAQVAQVFSQLSPAVQNTDRAKMYYIRAMDKLGRKQELLSYLNTNVINDGEYYLLQARCAYEQGNIARAVPLLDKSLNAPKHFSDYIAIKQQVFYYKALCATTVFDRTPSEGTYLAALEEWRNLGALFSTNKEHVYFREYRKETRRIGEKFRTLSQ